MADQMTTLGLERMAKNNAGIGAADPIDAMGWSDFGAISAGTTSIAAASNKQVNALESTPTLDGLEVTYVGLLDFDELNGATITTLTLHHDGAGANTGVGAGIDGLSITKSAKYALRSQITIAHEDTTP